MYWDNVFNVFRKEVHLGFRCDAASQDQAMQNAVIALHRGYKRLCGKFLTYVRALGMVFLFYGKEEFLPGFMRL
jgi:hypothetical protein